LDITAWLRSLGLEEYDRAFRENAIDADVLPDLTADDLKEIGVAQVGHRRKLLIAIAALRPSFSAGSSPDNYSKEHFSRTPSQAERRQLTVMFCDLVGSTALSTRLDPEEMRDVIGAYHASVAEVVNRFGGFIAKYMGDGVLVYFGYPIAHEDEASRAVRTGLALAEASGRLKYQTDIGPLQIRVGIATGLVVVGDLIGEGSAMEQAVVGETPNLAARLQSLAPAGAIVISPATRRLIGGEFDLEEMGPQLVKGLSEPILAWRVLGRSSVVSRFEAHMSGLTPLVGREEEIGILLRRWEQACDGEGQVVLLSGEPGVGKSRIIQALCERINTASVSTHLRIQFQCSPHYTNTAFYPFTEQTERAAGLEREDALSTKLDKLESCLAQWTDRIGELTPLLAAMLSLNSEERYRPISLSPQKQKEETISLLVEQLLALSKRRPVLVLFEDVHWIDPTSLEVLKTLVDRLSLFRVLLVGTFRPEFIAPWRSQPHVTLVSLNRLARRQSTALVESVTGGMRLPTEVLDQIVAKTDGVPLFVEELTKAVLESGFLMKQEGSYQLLGPLPPLAIPSTLQDSLMARLDRLAPVKEVAQIGAAIGREFSYPLLAMVSPITGPDLQNALEQLVASELIFASGEPPDANYTFKHALVQDAAYESLLKATRQQLHSRIAKALEEQWPEIKSARPELLAHHFGKAGIPEKAAAYGLSAGQLAARRSAFPEALAHLERALELLSDFPPGQKRQRIDFELKMEIADVLMASKGYAATPVGQAFQRAYAASYPAATTEERLAISWGLFAYHLVRAEYGTCLDLGRQVLHLGIQTRSNEPFVMAHIMVGHSLVQLGKLISAKRHFDHALVKLDPTTQGSGPASSLPEPYIALLTYSSFNLFLMGHVNQARSRSAEALIRAIHASRPHQVALVLGYSLRLHYCLQDFDTVRTQTEMLDKLATEHGFALYKASAAVWKSWLNAMDGQTIEAIALLEKGVSAYQATGAVWTVPFMLVELADVHGFAGDRRTSLETLDKTLQWIDQTKWWWLKPEVLRRRAELVRIEGDPRQAEHIFLQALALARKQGAKLWELRIVTNLARLWQTEGKQGAAFDVLTPICDFFVEGDETDFSEAQALLRELSECMPNNALEKALATH
jgi:class 3 adenylate cyclase/tetratricopeptide (TPR) repeat protein